MKLNKNLILICFTFIAFMFAGITNVYATASCDGLLTVEAANFISKIVGYIQIAAPILLIVLTTFDFASAVISEDKDSLKKATSKVVKRTIAAVAIFFVPLIISWILGIDAVKDSLNLVDDPMCGVEMGGTD